MHLSISIDQQRSTNLTNYNQSCACPCHSIIKWLTILTTNSPRRHTGSRDRDISSFATSYRAKKWRLEAAARWAIESPWTWLAFSIKIPGSGLFLRNFSGQKINTLLGLSIFRS
jgi:hypothetical protein